MLSYAVGSVVAALPITIQGFGLMEAVFYQILVLEGWCTASQMLALTLGYRGIALVLSLPGAIATLISPTALQARIARAGQ